jgi:hypothetical protein
MTTIHIVTLSLGYGDENYTRIAKAYASAEHAHAFVARCNESLAELHGLLAARDLLE